MTTRTPTLVLSVIAGLIVAQPAHAERTFRPSVVGLDEQEITNPMRGVYSWFTNSYFPQTDPPQDEYWRFNWDEIEPEQDRFDFSKIDDRLAQAEWKGRKFGFRISPLPAPEWAKQLVPLRPGCSGTDKYVPDWDSPQYIERATKVIRALGERYDDDVRLSFVDMHFYGNWGEWHTSGLCGGEAMKDTLIAIIDAHLEAFPTAMMVVNFGAMGLNEGEEPPDPLGYLYARNERVGLRGDNLGQAEFLQWREPWAKTAFRIPDETIALIDERWKTAPWITEVKEDPVLTEQQVLQEHISLITAFASQEEWEALSPEAKARYENAIKRAGYRYVLSEVTFTDTIKDGYLDVAAVWQNHGIAPAYEKWEVRYELTQGGREATFSGLSRTNLLKVLPEGDHPQTDRFCIPDGVAKGSYELSLIVRDPRKYRQPLRLAVHEMDFESGRVPLGQVVIERGADCSADAGSPAEAGVTEDSGLAPDGSSDEGRAPTRQLDSEAGCACRLDGKSSHRQWRLHYLLGLALLLRSTRRRAPSA
jgi:hypothetical protein